MYLFLNNHNVFIRIPNYSRYVFMNPQFIVISDSATGPNADLIRQVVMQLLQQRTGQTGLNKLNLPTGYSLQNQQTGFSPLNPQTGFQLSPQTGFNQIDLQTPQGPPGM